MRSILMVLLSIVFLINGYSQDNPDFLFWSSSHRLTTNDFGIKQTNLKPGTSFAQFTIDYSVNGFDFMTKNFNKKVKNAIIKSASWIDTTQHVASSLRYQQTLFDMAEVYVRKFRKELRDNRKQLIKGLNIVKEIDSKISSDFAKRRLAYDSETETGNNEKQQLYWEEQLKKELQELSDYEYGK